MKKITLGTCLILASASIASATVVFEFSDTEDGFTSAIPSVSSTDILSGISPITQTDNGDGSPPNLGNTTNGVIGAGFGLNSANGPATFSFQFDLGGLFSLDSVTVFSNGGNGNNGRVEQQFELFGSALEDPTDFDTADFTLIATVDSGANSGGDDFGAANITNIAGSFRTLLFVSTPPDGNEGTVFREIDVTGTAVIPEPSSTALLGLGFLGLIARRRR